MGCLVQYTDMACAHAHVGGHIEGDSCSRSQEVLPDHQVEPCTLKAYLLPLLLYEQNYMNTTFHMANILLR